MRRTILLLLLSLGCGAETSTPAPTPTRSADARPKKRTRAPVAPITSLASSPAPTQRPTPKPGPPVKPLALTVDPQLAIQNRIELKIRPADLRRIELGKTKFRLGFPQLTVNGQACVGSEVKLRGRLSLEFPRKSLNVKLRRTVELRRGEARRSLKRFYLTGLATDRGYFRAAVCLDLLRRLKRFPLFTTFAELRINSRSFGIYLVIERPVDALLKRGDAALVARRRLGKLADDGALAAKRTALSGQALLDRWDALTARVAQGQGAALQQVLTRGFDLPGLLTWVAFDLLVHNGDAGQAWVIAYPRGQDEARFDLLPWDYDQAFAAKVERDWPRPWLIRHHRPESKLGSDPVLFAAYRRRLAELAAWMEGPEVRATFEAVFQELAPYYAAPEVIANAARDRFGAVDLASLKTMMNAEYAGLIRRARAFR